MDHITTPTDHARAEVLLADMQAKEEWLLHNQHTASEERLKQAKTDLPHAVTALNNYVNNYTTQK